MTYARGLGKGGGGGHGGGHHGGGHHGGGYHGGRGFRRGLWYGGYGPGYINYASYSPCDECWSQPPSFVLPCLRARGCVVDSLGQVSVASSRNLMIGGALSVGLVGAGITWWLKGRRKKRKSS